ncbi:hypothetical protein AKN94_01025 [Thiopseudomonas alkaliphila]|uniref:O-antigen ligase family protein n=1 Tax=Thiopseudomonas alkaliphila TaxID=1697053 RepID=UPI00069FDD73|nr:O-antigen ligase family protein [Thiopseudomonas alkaliphila]AKX46108.1 hypothetical protein AKN94_01025 [Thiopseudomonas alkaliphila]AKX56103.1 hypothetical protein AKN90_10595 [Thiopseudomonas alkaliphila]
MRVFPGFGKSLHVRSSAGHKYVVFLLLATAVFGYVAGYHKLYAFHLVLSAYWLGILLTVFPVRRKTLEVLKFPIFFLFFVCLSVFWTPNISNGLTFIFYLLCGYSIVFSLVNYTVDFNRLSFVFKVLSFCYLLNFFVGLLETTGYFRLPMSPYYGLNMTAPSGFNSNLNNFGFVFVAIFPFVFLYPKRFVSIFGMLLAIWFLLKLGSKGFFLGLTAFFVFYFVSRIQRKSTWRWMSLITIGSFLLVLFFSVGAAKLNLDNRAFMLFSQIERATSLLREKELSVKDSTGVRAGMSYVGLNELFKTYGVGVGISGIGSKLASETDFFDSGKEIYSFHNFFLEMLIDVGVIPFIIIMVAYVKLALANIKLAGSLANKKLAYFVKSSGLSLLTIIPASIAPSSIIYVFTFWLVIGFSIASHLVAKRQLKHES